MSEERTEQPTYKRLRDARLRGQIPRSKDFHDAFQLGAAVAGLIWAGGYMIARLSDSVAAGIAAAGARAHQPLSPIDLSTLAFEHGASLALVVGPVALASVIGGLSAVTLQGGWSVSWEPVRPNLAKLSPANGLKRLVPSKAGIDLLKMIVLASILAWVCYRMVWTLIDQTPAFGRMAPADSFAAAWAVVLRLMKQALIVFVSVGSADYLLKRWQHRKSLKMTKQEVKDERRAMEGDPEIKARRMRMGMEIAMQRLQHSVPEADVIVTNPTHFSIAIKYDQATMRAPVVTAKGADFLAFKIRHLAIMNGVPIVERPPLARALYAGVDEGQEVHAEHYEAVAEVLAYVYRLEGKAA
jgi:flagellar biosynthetic protein FlhB